MAIGGEPPEVPKPEAPQLDPKLAALEAKFDSLCAAMRGQPPPRRPGGDPRRQRNAQLSKSGLPRPDPTFKGCWHCGGDHAGGRRQCPEFKAMLAANNNKIPDNYEGAYEKHVKSQQRNGTVNSIIPSGWQEHAETALPDVRGQFWSALNSATTVPKPKSFNDATQWDAFENVDDDDEQQIQDAIVGFQEFAHSVQYGPRLSQSQRRAQAKNSKHQPPPLTRAQIKQIADAISRGEIQLPDVTLESNEEWECLWALMDSGSSINGTDCDKSIPGANVAKSPSRARGDTYSCANG